jgi:hypothetical protein
MLPGDHHIFNFLKQFFHLTSLLGWPVESASGGLCPLKREKFLIFLTGKRDNGQRAQPVRINPPD